MPPNPENILQEAMKRATDAWRSKDYVTAEREYNLVRPRALPICRTPALRSGPLLWAQVYSNGSESVQIGAGAMLGAIGLARGDPAQARPYLDEVSHHRRSLISVKTSRSLTLPASASASAGRRTPI